MSGCHQLAKQITWEENKGEWGLFLALYRFRGGTIDLHPNYLRNTVGSARFGTLRGWNLFASDLGFRTGAVTATSFLSETRIRFSCVYVHREEWTLNWRLIQGSVPYCFPFGVWESLI